jgi:hypothetical protein
MKDWKEITYCIKVHSVLTDKDKQVVKDLEPSLKEMVKYIADYKANTIKDLKSTATGLKYVIISDEVVYGSKR